MEQKLDSDFTCPEIIQTLKDMQVLNAEGEGYIPTYMRTDLTDRLHDLFGFRTDTEIIVPKEMKKILKQTKK